MNGISWHEALAQCHQQGKAYVLVTIMGSMGSTPRDDGTKMVITDDSCFDTIGGGHLELQVIRKAKALLSEDRDQQVLEDFPLSSKLGQCCGGATHALFDVMTSHQQTVAVFGAGHVARALTPILAQLPLQIRWVDQREHEFPGRTPANISKIVTDEPTEVLSQLPQNSWVIVMTHDHQLDFDLVHQALKLGGTSYVGMIGSDTKARRFKTKLTHRQLSPHSLERFHSPIGLDTIPGKRPIEVAVSISAQLIQMLHVGQLDKDVNAQKQHWLTTRAITS